jgi:hypothetical protein
MLASHGHSSDRGIVEVASQPSIPNTPMSSGSPAQLRRESARHSVALQSLARIQNGRVAANPFQLD